MTLRDVPHTDYAVTHMPLHTLAAAIRTVAGHAHDAADLIDLLWVLGIDPPTDGGTHG